jgi:O-acetyl-ADP-ribose deacetylase (regulator of RNase III)
LNSYPLREGAEVAVSTVKEFVRNHPGELDLVERVLFDWETFEVYDEAYRKRKMF